MFGIHDLHGLWYGLVHGSNDEANAVGPVAAVGSTVQSGGVIGAEAIMPWWVLGIGAVGIVIGLATYGWRVIQTIGQKITELTPSRDRRRACCRIYRCFGVCHWITHINHSYARGRSLGCRFGEGLRQCLVPTIGAFCILAGHVTRGRWLGDCLLLSLIIFVLAHSPA